MKQLEQNQRGREELEGCLEEFTKVLGHDPTEEPVMRI
jgi:hypothetical protein